MHPSQVLDIKADLFVASKDSSWIEMTTSHVTMDIVAGRTDGERVNKKQAADAAAQRARRMEIPDRVTVVALRRVEGHSHGETDVEWHHRWLVRGHWRWQHVSKNHPLAEPDPAGGYRARVWVRPHVKGPEDKPFHLTEKVYALVR